MWRCRGSGSGGGEGGEDVESELLVEMMVEVVVDPGGGGGDSGGGGGDAGGGGGEGGLLHCWWECKLVQPLWRRVWRFLKKLEIKQIGRAHV